MENRRGLKKIRAKTIYNSLRSIHFCLEGRPKKWSRPTRPENGCIYYAKPYSNSWKILIPVAKQALGPLFGATFEIEVNWSQRLINIFCSIFFWTTSIFHLLSEKKCPEQWNSLGVNANCVYDFFLAKVNGSSNRLPPGAWGAAWPNISGPW